MRRHLPPLNALKSFEAAARHESFTKAAVELCVTQGAVSKQIRLLETFFDAPLFERHSARVTLTALGTRYLPIVTDTLDTLNSATHNIRLRSPAQETLLIDSLPSFTSTWLISRLKYFESEYPDYDVQLITGDGKPDFAESEADLAIRCIPTAHSPPGGRLILNERLLLIAPAAATNKNTTVENLKNYKLLQQTTRPDLWRPFLQQTGLCVDDFRIGPGFQHFFMIMEAVKEGLGIGLIPDFLAADAIHQNLVCNPFQLKLDSEFAYYLFSPGHKSESSRVNDFTNWLSRRIQKTRIDLITG